MIQQEMAAALCGCRTIAGGLFVVRSATTAIEKDPRTLLAGEHLAGEVILLGRIGVVA
jgi:hypothetical protein